MRVSPATTRTRLAEPAFAQGQDVGVFVVKLVNQGAIVGI